MRRKKYFKPEVIRIPIDFNQMVRNVTCPFVLVWNGRRYLKENSLLPDSENLLRKEKILTDYYVLKNEPHPRYGYLSLKIRETVNDISWFDNFKLFLVETKIGYKIAFDSNGQMYSYKTPFGPTECIDENGKSYFKKVNSRDFYNPSDFLKAKAGDVLYLDFGKVNNNFSKLIIVDPLAGCDCLGVCTDFGSCTWFCADVGSCNCNKVKISIHVFVFIEHQWQKIAVLHTRAEFYPDIINLIPYLPQIKGNLKIKLRFTETHKVSFVGIDSTPPIPMKKRVYQLAQATHSELGDVTKVLREENNQFTRLMPGEEIELKFPVPEPARSGNKLSYVLVSRGYYIPVSKLMSLSKKAAFV